VGARYDLSTGQGRSAAADEIADVLAGIASPIEQDYYIQEAARLLKTDVGAVRQLLRRTRPGGAPPATVGKQPTPNHGERDTEADVYQLALLMRIRQLPEQPTIDARDLEFIGPESRAVYVALGGELPPELEPYADRARRWLPVVERMPTERLMSELADTQRFISKRLLEQQRAEISALIRAVDDDEEEVRKWTGQLTELARRIGEIDGQLPSERERAAIG
jgi:DNA primase